MKKIIKISALAALVLTVAACAQKEKTAAAKMSPAQECMAKTDAVRGGVFKNECIGLAFQSKTDFLYTPPAGPTQVFDMAVPKDNYSIRVMVFNNPMRDIKTPDAQKAFLAQAKKNFADRNPNLQVTKAEIISLGNAPAVYIAASGKGRIERHYFFNNKGQWTQLSLNSTDKNFSTQIKPAQDALLKTVTLS